MYFVSQRLVAQLNVDGALQRHASDTVRSANDSRKERFLPWEDVFTGMALAQSASGGALASVHMHMALYAEGWQFASTPSVLLWHMKAKNPDRIVEVERWSSQQQPCVPSAVSLTCGNTFTSCNGDKWLRCMSLHNKTACATKRVHLSTEDKSPTRPASSRMGRNALDKLRGVARACSSHHPGEAAGAGERARGGARTHLHAKHLVASLEGQARSGGGFKRSSSVT